MAPPTPESPFAGLGGPGKTTAPPEARLPTKAHDCRFTCPATLRIAPPHTTASRWLGSIPCVGDCAALPTKEQLVAFTVPPRLKIAPPLAFGFKASLPAEMVAVFPTKVTPVRFTVPPRFKMAEPPKLVPSAIVSMASVKVTLVLLQNTR